MRKTIILAASAAILLSGCLLSKDKQVAIAHMLDVLPATVTDIDFEASTVDARHKSTTTCRFSMKDPARSLALTIDHENVAPSANYPMRLMASHGHQEWPVSLLLSAKEEPHPAEVQALITDCMDALKRGVPSAVTSATPATQAEEWAKAADAARRPENKW